MNSKDNFKIDFAGIGAMKCATTWIYECLKEHPEIEMPPKDQRDKALFFKENPTKEEIEEYKNWFDKDNTLKGDFHVHYLESEEACKRMKEYNKSMKIIVCLRDPVERAWSHYNYYKFRVGSSDLTFKQAVRENPEILKLGLYYKHLKKYYELFNGENILVLNFDDIKKDKLKFIQEIYNFLEVNKSFKPPSLNIKLNLTAFKQTFLGKILHQKIIAFFLRHTRWAWNLKDSIMIKKILGKFSGIWSKGGDNAMSQSTKKYLRDYYKEDLKKLESLIGDNIKKWYQYEN